MVYDSALFHEMFIFSFRQPGNTLQPPGVPLLHPLPQTSVHSRWNVDPGWRPTTWKFVSKLPRYLFFVPTVGCTSSFSSTCYGYVHTITRVRWSADAHVLLDKSRATLHELFSKWNQTIWSVAAVWWWISISLARVDRTLLMSYFVTVSWVDL